MNGFHDTSITCLSRRDLVASTGVAVAAVAALGVSNKVGAQATPVASPAAGPVPSELSSALTRAVAKAMLDAAIPGAVVYLGLPGNEPWVKAFGAADKANQVPMSIDTRLRIGSVTKTFTATVVLQLVDEGKLRLDDTIGQFRISVPGAAEITIRNLLNMTSGLVNYTETEQYLEHLLADPTATWTLDEVIALAIDSSLPAPSKLGEYYYCNTNYIILGKLIEGITGQSIGDALQERIFNPLGLSGTGYGVDPRLPEPASRGYGYAGEAEVGATPEPSPVTPAAAPNVFDAAPDADGIIDLTDVNASSAGPAGAAWSTVTDLAAWLPALYDGATLSPELRQERLNLVPVDPSDPAGGGYGLGIVDFGGLFGHDGDFFGASCIAVRAPETGLTLVVITNLFPPKGDETSAQTVATAIFETIGQ